MFCRSRAGVDRAGDKQQGAEAHGPERRASSRISRTPQTRPNPTNPYNNTGRFVQSAAGSSSERFGGTFDTAVDTTPKAVTVGNAKIIADQRANTIIVLGNREVVVKVAKILDEMDVKAPQVALSTVIGELTLK